MAETVLQTETPAYDVMKNHLGEQGMALLDQQLAVWQELNSRELESPLKNALSHGDTTLPKGTLLHSASMHEAFDEDVLGSIASLGIISGELTGVYEDAETHGCADFFRVAEATTIAGYMDFAGETVIKGALRIGRGERLAKRGVTFIVDPNAEGMAGLLVNDGYTNPDMAGFVHPPNTRTAEMTAAILGGVPRGAISGAIISPSVLKEPHLVEMMHQLFPELPVFDQDGQPV